MKYNLQQLIDQYQKGQSLDFLFFWGHQPSKDGSIIKSCFSQWWMSSFEVDGVTYHSAEHWMMAGKAKLFGDDEILQNILNTESPKKAKAYGRKVRNFDSQIWNENCYEIVKQGNFHKFSQHEDLKNFLLSTDNQVLVEASPYDKIWGIGMLESNKKAAHPPQWNGMNLLGFALMEVRDELQ